MLIVPNDCRHSTNRQFRFAQQNNDLNLFPLFEYRRGVQSNAAAAYVDAGAPEIGLRIRTCQENRNLNRATKISPSLSDHLIIGCIERSPYLFGVQGRSSRRFAPLSSARCLSEAS